MERFVPVQPGALDQATPGVDLADDPVERAKAAEHLLWSLEAHSLRFAVVRDAAVHQALEAGVPAAHIGQALGVLTSDVVRMDADHLRRPL